MKQAAEVPTTKSRSDDASLGVGVIAITFLDTTWRIAVPVILGAALGIWADRSWGTKPWLTLLAVVIGFVFAGLLLKRQLDAVMKQEKTK
jgi:predicted F0F1-ATPase subunit